MFETRKLKKALQQKLSELEPGTAEYEAVLNNYEKMTKAQANENGWMWPSIFGFINTAATCATSVVQVKQITKFEKEGHILNTKSSNYIQKIPSPGNTQVTVKGNK